MYRDRTAQAAIIFAFTIGTVYGMWCSISYRAYRAKPPSQEPTNPRVIILRPSDNAPSRETWIMQQLVPPLSQDGLYRRSVNRSDTRNEIQL